MSNIRDGRSPCSGLYQRSGKVGRHRGFGMRRDHGALFARVAQEQVTIGDEGLLVEGQHRQRHASISRMPALRCDKAAVQPEGAGRHAADAIVEQEIFTDRERRHG